MVLAHVTWSSLKTWSRKMSVKNATKSLFWVKVCICQNRLSIDVMCPRTVKVSLAYVSERKHWHQPSKIPPQHLFPELNSVVINQVVLHSDNQSTWLQKRKRDFLRRPAAFALLDTKRTDDISIVGYSARIEVLAEVPIVWFDSRWSHWDFSLILSFRPQKGPGVDSAS